MQPSDPRAFQGSQALYRLVGESDWQHPLESSIHIPEGETSEIYEFVIPPYPEGTSGDIEWYYEYVFDGRPNRVDGVKRIAFV